MDVKTVIRSELTTTSLALKENTCQIYPDPISVIYKVQEKKPKGTTMSDIKVKAYGLVELTKKQYLIIQVIGFSILIACFATSIFVDFSNSEGLLRYMREGSLLILVLEIFETAYMFKKFKTAENDA